MESESYTSLALAIERQFTAIRIMTENGRYLTIPDNLMEIVGYVDKLKEKLTDQQWIQTKGTIEANIRRISDMYITPDIQDALNRLSNEIR